MNNTRQTDIEHGLAIVTNSRIHGKPKPHSHLYELLICMMERILIIFCLILQTVVTVEVTSCGGDMANSPHNGNIYLCERLAQIFLFAFFLSRTTKKLMGGFFV